jgi:hypothetical protein
MKDYFVPQWIATFFMLVFPIAVFLVARLAKRNAPTHQQNKVFYSVLAFYGLYLGAITLGSFNGVFNRAFFPPLIILFGTLPLAIFLFTVVIKSKIYQTILEKTTLQDLVSVHIFRVIGVFFILIALHDALPKPFAFIAGLGDIITAVSSIFVAKAIVSKHPNARKYTYIWNTFGLIDIILTAIMANVLTKLSMDTGIMGVDTLAKFPFCLIPAFAPPTIIFLHVAIYHKLKRL